VRTHGGRLFGLRRDLAARRLAGLWLPGTVALGIAGAALADGPIAPMPFYGGAPQQAMPLEDPPGIGWNEADCVAPLPTYDAPHTAAMEQVALEADKHTFRGFELAGRRAYFSAREEFIQALRTISQALDVQQGATSHSEALAAGMRALEEANDFVPRGAGLEANLNVPMIVSAHRTPVYQAESLDGVTALVARQRYYTYAREQLGVCVGRELAGSMALYGLGKLCAELATEKREQLGGSEAEAIVYFQASLLATPQNHLASNDLGAMMARKGSWLEARELFLQSLETHETAAAWTNLAKTHERLGEKALAAKATEEAKLALQAEAPRAKEAAASTAVRVEWVAPNGMTTAASEQFLNNTQPTNEKATATMPAPTPEAPPRAAQSWWPWKRNSSAK
jgi:tetratricopeptide (TPR) repeat protein